MNLSEANRKAKKMIEQMAQVNISKSLPGEDRDILFLIRDGIVNNPLDPEELEKYDDCYGVDLCH